jgi:inosine/xanthosine triphosphate pyrophosphatase family protein
MRGSIKEKSTDYRSGIGIVGGRSSIRQAKGARHGVLLTKNQSKQGRGFNYVYL